MPLHMPICWKWAKQIPVWNVPIYDNLWNLKLSHLN
jgi:hypothetical protein